MLWCIDITLSAVVNIKAVALSSRSIRVTWQDPPHSNRTAIIAYSVHFLPTSLDQSEVQRVVTAANETLRNLRPNTEYLIYVTAYSYQGTSRPSRHVRARTLSTGTALPVLCCSNSLLALSCRDPILISREHLSIVFFVINLKFLLVIVIISYGNFSHSP